LEKERPLNLMEFKRLTTKMVTQLPTERTNFPLANLNTAKRKGGNWPANVRSRDYLLPHVAVVVGVSAEIEGEGVGALIRPIQSAQHSQQPLQPHLLISGLSAGVSEGRQSNGMAGEG